MAIAALLLAAEPSVEGQVEAPHWGAGGAPIVGYSSDVGLTLGAVGNLYRFGQDRKPYLASLSAHVLYSTGGIFEVAGGIDVPGTTRWFLSGGFSRNAFMPYYGVSDAATRDPSRPSSYYTFSQHAPYASTMVRRSILGSFFWFAGYRLEALTLRPHADSLLADQGGYTLSGQRYAEGYAGLLLDTRDVEADPRSGHLIELSGRAGSPIFGSQFSTEFIFASVAIYRTVLPRVVVAARVAGEAGHGDIPLPVLADFGAYGLVQGLGGASTLRGYYLQQFIGPEKLLGNLEARWRVIETHWGHHPFAVTAVAFGDVGRVSGPVVSGLWGLHGDVGTGARITWEDVFVLRFDAGFSPGQQRFFVTLGQLF